MNERDVLLDLFFVLALTNSKFPAYERVVLKAGK